MSKEDFEKAFSEQVKNVTMPDRVIRSLGLGRKIQNAYSRHKKTVLLTSLITGLSFGILNMTQDGIRHYRIGMERAAESIIVRRAEQSVIESDNKVSELENTIIKLTSYNQELNDIINEAQSVDSRRVTELNTLRRDYAISTQRITDLEQQIRLFERNNTDNDSVLSEKQREIDVLTIRLSNYENIITQYDAQLISRDNRIMNLEEQIRTYNSQNINNNDLLSQIEQLNMQIEQNQTLLRTYERQLVDYHSQVTERNNTINSLESQLQNISSSNNDNSELQRQVQQLNQQITSYESQIRQQENVISTRDSRINTLEEQLSNTRTESDNINRLNSQVQQLNQQVNNYERQIEDYQRQITENTNTISSLEHELQGTRTFETINNNLQNYVERLTKEITQYQSQLNSYERQISQQNSQISSLNITINSLNNQISSLRNNTSSQSTTNIPQANDTYDSSAINLLSSLSNNASDKELILQLDNYDAVLYYSHNQKRIILDIIDKGCRTSCTSHARITSSQNNLYSLEWGSFNHLQGGYSLGKDAFDRALGMIR